MKRHRHTNESAMIVVKRMKLYLKHTRKKAGQIGGSFYDFMHIVKRHRNIRRAAEVCLLQVSENGSEEKLFLQHQLGSVMTRQDRYEKGLQ